MVLFCRLYVNLHGFGKISTMLFCFAVVEMAPKKFFFYCVPLFGRCVFYFCPRFKIEGYETSRFERHIGSDGE